MSSYKELDFQRWYANTRRQQMSESTARQIFFSGSGITTIGLADLACSQSTPESHATKGNNINGTTELTEEDLEDAEEIYWQWENGYARSAVEKVHAIRANHTIELDCCGFDEWWNDTVKDGQWTSLERLAARDAWHAALNRAARFETRSGVTTDVGE